MCFRPSAVDGAQKNNVQTGTCPTCGQPVAAAPGITSGTCPYCGNAIPVNPTSDASNAGGSGQNVKIL